LRRIGWNGGSGRMRTERATTGSESTTVESTAGKSDTTASAERAKRGIEKEPMQNAESTRGGSRVPLH